MLCFLRNLVQSSCAWAATTKWTGSTSPGCLNGTNGVAQRQGRVFRSREGAAMARWPCSQLLSFSVRLRIAESLVGDPGRRGVQSAHSHTTKQQTHQKSVWVRAKGHALRKRSACARAVSCCALHARGWAARTHRTGRHRRGPTGRRRTCTALCPHRCCWSGTGFPGKHVVCDPCSRFCRPWCTCYHTRHTCWGSRSPALPRPAATRGCRRCRGSFAR